MTRRILPRTREIMDRAVKSSDELRKNGIKTAAPADFTFNP